MDVYVVVVSYNGSAWIKGCLESLRNSSVPVKGIIIDNASEDGTPDIVSKEFPFAEVIRNRKNSGFGKANNIGIRKALEYGADYILLLNQDAAIKPDTIEKLIEVFESHPGYGILSPVHYHNDKLIDYLFLHFMRRDVTPGIINDFITGDLKKVYQTTFVNAAIWLISAKCLRTVGGFAPVFPHYGEDNNFIHRCNFHNFKTGIVPGAKGYHFRDQKISDVPLKKRIYHEYISLLIEAMNPNQSFFVAFRKTASKYLIKAGLHTLFLNILILLINIPRLLLNLPSIISQKAFSKKTFAFLDQK